MKFNRVKVFKLIISFVCSLFLFTISCKIKTYDQINQNIKKKKENTSFLCPIVSIKETKEDCPWAAITRRMIASDKSEYSIKNILKNHSPILFRVIKEDAQRINLKNLWGKSINYDAIKKDIIVHPSILKTIFKLAKVALPIASKKHNGKKVIVHAGIMHTYGYIFSNLLTPYGYKRSRWVKDDIEAGFKLPRGILGPQPSSGTLFTNITYFISQIAFNNEAKILSKVKTRNVPVILKDFNYKNLKIRRLEETVNLTQNRKVILRTDLVEFIKKQNEMSNDHLLIYSFLDSSEKTPLLITTFPVSKGFVKSLFKESNLGKNKLIKTRYNAFISGFTDTDNSYKGTRIER